jgi:hypothetical protein
MKGMDVRRDLKDCWNGRDVVGAIAFGSYLSADEECPGDLDILIVKRKGKWSKVKIEDQEIPLHVITFPMCVVEDATRGVADDPLVDSFLFSTFRSGTILYDPEGSVEKYRQRVKTRRIPDSHVDTLLGRACGRLALAEENLREGRIEGSELEIRRAAEEVGMALLLREDIPEIYPPKKYLPRLRKHLPDFYEKFIEINNMGKLDLLRISEDMAHLHRWRRGFIIRLAGTDWLDGAIDGANSELDNVQRCLEKEDVDGALLELRYAVTLLTSPAIKLQEGTPVNRVSERVSLLYFANNPFIEAFDHVMGFTRNEVTLRSWIRFLGSIPTGSDAC